MEGKTEKRKEKNENFVGSKEWFLLIFLFLFPNPHSGVPDASWLSLFPDVLTIVNSAGWERIAWEQLLPYALKAMCTKKRGQLLFCSVKVSTIVGRDNNTKSKFCSAFFPFKWG